MEEPSGRGHWRVLSKTRSRARTMQEVDIFLSHQASGYVNILKTLLWKRVRKVHAETPELSHVLVMSQPCLSHVLSEQLSWIDKCKSAFFLSYQPTSVRRISQRKTFDTSDWIPIIMHFNGDLFVRWKQASVFNMLAISEIDYVVCSPGGCAVTPSSVAKKTMKLSSLSSVLLTMWTFTFSYIRFWARLVKRISLCDTLRKHHRDSGLLKFTDWSLIFFNFLIEIEKQKSLRFDKIVSIFYYC